MYDKVKCKKYIYNTVCLQVQGFIFFFCHFKVRNVSLEWIYGVLAWNISALDRISQFFST